MRNTLGNRCIGVFPVKLAKLICKQKQLENINISCSDPSSFPPFRATTYWDFFTSVQQLAKQLPFQLVTGYFKSLTHTHAHTRFYEARLNWRTYTHTHTANLLSRPLEK